MIQNLIFLILFLKIFFQAYNFSSHIPVDIVRVFLFQNLQQKISKPIKTSQKDHSSYSFAQKTSLILRISTLETENNMLPKHSQKASVYKFSSKQICFCLAPGAIQKYVTCKMAFFTPFYFVTLHQFYSATSPPSLCHSVNFMKKLQHKREKDFFAYMAVFQHVMFRV